MGAFLARLRQVAPAEPWDSFDNGGAERLEKFAASCPLYAREIEREPALARWLESSETRTEPLSLRHLLDATLGPTGVRAALDRQAVGHPGFLRRFRRKMTMRIAYREVASFASPDSVVEELTRLAEMMIRECYFIAILKANQRWGEPGNELGGQPAKFTILGLGKLGGRELNFSSDVDLIYLYEGDGYTHQARVPTHTTNAEYFQRVAEAITGLLNERDANGFLYRADVRLRPGGGAAPLVSSVDAAEHYYAGTGQTWERLALLKARPVAGAFDVGAEFLENLHSFRYPRHPPASLLMDVAAMKQRTEREVVGVAALERDIKSGYGGIREIEFIAQVLQLLHAGRFPFLQTTGTIEAYGQLVRYELFEADEASFLIDTYWFLRRVEHRLQMAEEQQTHELPENEQGRANLASSLGFPSAQIFEADLGLRREHVRRQFARLFATSQALVADPMDPWWPFFADGHIGENVRSRIETWFAGDSATDAAHGLRRFVRGEQTGPLGREQVQRFAALLPALDRALPQLARPCSTLDRISAFAERYGSRNQFLAACTLNPELFEVLALLFDRSQFIAGLLQQHPEILEEVLRPEILRKRKDLPSRRRELGAYCGPTGADFGAWLWLYVRAEQVRAAIGHLLGFVSDDEIGSELTATAEATLAEVTARTAGADNLLIVALGKLGGAEISYGSDLDLLFVGHDGGLQEEESARAVVQLLGGWGLRPPVYEIDPRLRPHGDAGPLVATLTGYRDYFTRSAQPWERQVLTRARILSGPTDLVADWQAFISETVFAGPLGAEDATALWRMRLRIQKDRDVARPPQRSFKTGPGGAIDVEFIVQILQMHHGATRPEVRTPDTREGLRRLEAAGVLAGNDARSLLENHRKLQSLEWCLRRDTNRRINVIPEALDERRALARWLGTATWDAFWEDHLRSMAEIREVTYRLLTGVVPSTTLETSR